MSLRDAARGAEGRLCRTTQIPGRLDHFLAGQPQLPPCKKKDNQSILSYQVQFKSLGPLFLEHLLCAGSWG